jgi:hypothetical protein
MWNSREFLIFLEDIVMAGIAGQMIGLAATPQIPIGGLTRVKADAGSNAASGKGCDTNFIGFGLGATSTEQLPADFQTTEDDARRAWNGAAQRYVPTYTGAVLTWVLTP